MTSKTKDVKIKPSSIVTRQKGERPKMIPTWQIPLLKAAIGLSFVMLGVGCVGLIVLTDKEKTRWISQTLFAEYYHKLIEFNPFFSAFFVNGGLLVGILSYVRIKNHYDAVEIEYHQLVINHINQKEAQGKKGGKGNKKTD